MEGGSKEIQEEEVERSTLNLFALAPGSPEPETG